MRLRRQRAALALCLLGALVPAGTATSQPAIEAKQAEAEHVLAQIGQIDAELELAVEAYNAAQVELDRIREEQRVNRRRLEIARSNLGAAEDVLHARLVELYTQGDQDLLEVLLGAASLDEVLERVDTAHRVSDQDTRIVLEVQKFRAEMKRRHDELADARRRQEELIAERAEQRRSIEAQLAERQRLLASIRSEIERLKAEEAERQRRLQAQAQARLEAQQAEAQQAETQEAAPSSEPAAAEPQAAPAAPAAPAADGAITTAAPAPQHGGVVGIAMQYLGIPYQWGGTSPSTGFDCSGFTMYVYGRAGVSLPHSAAAQYGYGSAVDRSQLAPGDLVFFNGLGHVGIYIGGNQFIHSPHSGDVVKISTISSWYADTYVGARRL